MKTITYASEPTDAKKFTNEFDRFYTIFAKTYAFFINLFPVWKKWIGSALPYIEGPNVLEISFGTAYLLSRYAEKHNTYAMDYNANFVKLANIKLGTQAKIQQADVEHMPYANNSFDCIINTMAFTGYPDGQKALMEMKRVLKPNGRLIMVDIDYPQNKNRMGVILTKFWIAMGDLVRDMHSLFNTCEFEFEDKEIGGFGSVHLYLARKK